MVPALVIGGRVQQLGVSLKSDTCGVLGTRSTGAADPRDRLHMFVLACVLLLPSNLKQYIVPINRKESLFVCIAYRMSLPHAVATPPA